MSTPYYHRVDTTLRDAIIVQNVSGTFVTGLTNADFTKKLSKNGTGNQSTAGITITEVDSTNNPGEYEVEAAATSFVADEGTYTLMIYRTAAPTYSYEQVYVVNATGTSEATPASFTATASDGRIIDGTDPLASATVYITDAGNSFITQTTTGATGLWGPVYLTDGTYTVRAQKNGYTQGTGTITVSGSTVTGPGADITCAVGSTTDFRSAAQLWAYARRQAVDLTGTKADAIIKSAVNDALDMLSSERQWSHLLRKYYIPLKGAYSTGTIAVATGGTDVTLTTGTWPSWAASGKIFVGNQILDVATRSSNSVVTLAQAYDATAISGSTYVLYQNEYDLPDDMWKFHRPLPGQRWGYGGSARPMLELLEAENGAAYGQHFPSMFAVANGSFVCWPYPDTDYMLGFTYFARPARLSTDTDVADIDPVHIECMRRAIDYQLARQLGKVVAGDANTTLAAYKEALSRIVDNDKTPIEIDAVGSEPMAMGRKDIWKRRTV
jgi:hypothetical protein